MGAKGRTTILRYYNVDVAPVLCYICQQTIDTKKLKRKRFDLFSDQNRIVGRLVNFNEISGKSSIGNCGSRGIGKATALKLAGEGATVAVHYSRAMDKAEAVCEEIRDLGQEAIPVQADIADRDAVNRMVGEVTKEFSTIDLLVNNAGDVGDMTFDELTPEHWDRIIAINLTGPFNVLWAVKPGMIEQQFGRIVNVSSIAALAVRPNQLPYAAAKAGIISLTKSCCGPLAQHNIRINSVAPGAIATDMLGEVFNRDGRAAARNNSAR